MIEKVIGTLVILFVVGVIALFWVAIEGFKKCELEKSQMIMRCMSDGRPDYECAAMFKHYCKSGSSRSTVFVPRSGR